jgi:hypothetical protein
MDIAFPGESAEYRTARDRLLEQEIELRRAMEAAPERPLPVSSCIGDLPTMTPGNTVSETDPVVAAATRPVLQGGGSGRTGSLASPEAAAVVSPIHWSFHAGSNCWSLHRGR